MSSQPDVAKKTGMFTVLQVMPLHPALRTDAHATCDMCGQHTHTLDQLRECLRALRNG